MFCLSTALPSLLVPVVPATIMEVTLVVQITFHQHHMKCSLSNAKHPALVATTGCERLLPFLRFFLLGRLRGVWLLLTPELGWLGSHLLLGGFLRSEVAEDK